MSEAAVLEAPVKAPVKLIRPKDEAIGHLSAQIQRGLEVKAMRIRSGQELDQARAAKLEWTTRTTDLLNDLFDQPCVAEECNDWVGRIYPEYAEFGNFVEQFYAEMDHRIGRLKSVLRRVEKTVVPVRASAVSAPTSEPSVQPAPPAPQGTVLVAPRLQELSGLLVVRKVDEPMREAVATFLESLDIEMSVVEETKDMCDMLDRDREIRFAVILSAEGHNDHHFELGFCAGRLGLSRVILLNAHSSGAPDGRNLPQLQFDACGGWQLQLARQLRRSGIPIDLNKLC